MRAGGTAGAPGYTGHLPTWSVGPEALTGWEQWCCPLRRQQAGRFEPPVEANSVGLINVKLKNATSSDAAILRM
jgi:hypothetical protein